MIEREMNFSEIHPFIRYVQRIRIGRETYPAFSDVCPYDCRLFYVTEGRGTLRVAGELRRLCKGQAMLWHAGTDYHIRSDEDDPLVLLGLNFDYTQSLNRLTLPIPPDPIDGFDPSREWEHVRFRDFPRLNHPVVINNMQLIEEPLNHMLREFKSQKLFCAAQLSGLAADILVTVSRKLVISESDKNASTTRIDEVIDYIREHYPEKIDNESLGSIFGYHPNYLNRQIKLYTGKSMHQYLIAYRISRAVDLLVSTDLPVSDIADRVGFNDLCHFSKIFKQKTGLSPGQLRVLSPMQLRVRSIGETGGDF